MKRVAIIRSDENWTGLYVDGDLKHEHHELNGCFDTVLLCVKYFAKRYSFGLEDIDEYITGDDLEDYGYKFPQSLEDFDWGDTEKLEEE